jgi:hypothetical protein
LNEDVLCSIFLLQANKAVRQSRLQPVSGTPIRSPDPVFYSQPHEQFPLRCGNSLPDCLAKLEQHSTLVQHFVR